MHAYAILERMVNRKDSHKSMPRVWKYWVWTVGCQMNVSDSNRLEAALQSIGYNPAMHPEEASFIVLNSCSVRASAERRIIGKLYELQRIKHAHPDTCIVLWGCMVGPNNESVFKAQLPMVDYFVAPSAVDEVVALAPNPVYHLDGPVLPVRDWSNPPVSVYIPIQYGCNMRCSYCVIPLRRGRERSRPMDEIVQEVHEVVARGAKEITLLGQIVDSWGHDLPGKPDLSMLLEAVDAIPGLVRLRFLTSHPAWMTERLIATVGRLPRCQPEMNVPLQAGHDELLQRMRRGYTVERYQALVAAIRSHIPHGAISTDVIVGHPGETEEHFAQTLALVEALRFDKVHIAAFSARPGTQAAEEEHDAMLAVDEAVKQARRRAIEEVQERIATEIHARLLHTTVEVLVEGKAKDKWRGRTGTNTLVFFAYPDDLTGQLVQVHITNTSPWSLQGSMV